MISGVQYLPPAVVRFNRAQQALWYGGNGPFSAFSGVFAGFTQVQPGTYPLQIQDAPHSATRVAYYAFTQFHKTWFRIGLSLSGSRFLHVGEISEGCVTVRAFLYDSSKPSPAGFEDLAKLAKKSPGALGLPYPTIMPPLVRWDNLYEYLIIRRANDQSVGSLMVL